MEASHYGRQRGSGFIFEKKAKHTIFKKNSRSLLQVNYHEQAQAGDPDHITLWDRIETKPEETIFKTVSEGEESAF